MSAVFDQLRVLYLPNMYKDSNLRK